MESILVILTGLVIFALLVLAVVIMMNRELREDAIEEFGALRDLVVAQLWQRKRKARAASAAQVPATQPNGGRNDNDSGDRMDPLLGHSIGVAVFWLPALILFLIGAAIGNWNTAFGFGLIWPGVLAWFSFKIRRVRTFFLVERFGLFWKIQFAGLRLAIPFVDKIVFEDDFLQKKVTLFTTNEQDGKITRKAIDFTDGSSPVDIEAWYQIGNPDDVDSGNKANLTRQIFAYVYRVKDDERDPRIKSIIEGALRPRLQKLSIQDVQTDGGDISPAAKAVVDETAAQTEADLETIGVHFTRAKSIIINDIDLPPDIIKYREQKLKGLAIAQEVAAASAQYVDPIIEIKKRLHTANISLDDSEIVKLYMQQKGLETVKGSKTTFVAKDLQGMLLSVGVDTNEKGG